MGTSFVRLIAGIALGLSFGGAWACRDQGFACGKDADCSLSGVPGFCQDDGNCAYPDADCAGGLRYPVGAPGDLAERCVGDSDAEPTTSDRSTHGSSDSDDGLAGTISGGSASVSSTGAGQTGASDTAESCPQESSEPNDVLADAAAVAPQGCSFTVEGALGGQDEFDYYIAPIGFEPDEGCESTWAIEHATDDMMQTCLLARCVLGEDPAFACGTGAEPLSSDWWQCCSEGDFSAAVACNQSLPQLGLRVGGTGECIPYSVSVSG